ncbi:putative regulatory protein, FmdB family [Syntrophobacter sp. SbD1]|nr:putative regulatory protein, FmdB family [Syntrophobacter sp. SbD1]
MPLYEYRCTKCGDTFEQLILGESEPMSCPKCQGEVEKLISSFSIDISDEICAKVPRGEQRERCTACKREPAQCPFGA